MALLTGFFGYLLAFVGLCIFIVLVFAFTNILRKSYDSQNAVIVVAFISLLFIINSIFLFFSYSRLATDLQYSNLNLNFDTSFQSNSRAGF
jgi:hypothetical protein